MFLEKKINGISLTKSDLLDLCHVFSDLPGTCLFFSGGDFSAAEKSHLCLYPVESFRINDKSVFHFKPGSSKPEFIKLKNPWDGLKKILGLTFSQSSPIPDWIGYLGYELGGYSDIEKTLTYQPSSIPDACFIRPSIILTLEHRSGEVKVNIREQSLSFLSEEQRKIADLLCTAKGIEEVLLRGKQKGSEIFDTALALHRPIEDPEKYKQKIEFAKELIREGEIYQVNLSQQFELKGKHSPFRIFQKVADINPAPFMAYLHFDDFTLVSSSPERFLCKRGDTLETRPIKGTIPRGNSPEQDAANRVELLKSPKERAELLMITDLMRNDLGKVSRTGSVITEDIWHCEAYANVYHMVSIIRSLLKPHLHPADILRKTFPGGSITGCPKLRAMEVIYDLEKRPRGIYTGSIGYIACNGDFDFNIAIRTILCQEDILKIQLGGAIVADSEAQKEYEETLHKGASLFKTLEMDSVFMQPY